MLAGKKILLGVCGSIACYKSAALVRLLVKANANVKVVMTADATQFITPLTLSTLSKEPVFVEYADKKTGTWNNHVDLALWADFLLIAPATANTLAKFANGLCDNLLSAIYLSAKCPVLIAPAMDLDMWKHPATQTNINKLISYNHKIIQPGYGELASGLIGEGRMAEPEEIVDFISNLVASDKPLTGKRALVTAGPTYEAIDPVRFIGNHSSGKMGFEIAEELANLGAQVHLISGPTSLTVKNPAIKRSNIVSAADMYKEVNNAFPDADITVMSAAVADYTPKEVASLKIKKNDESFAIELVKTQDVLANIGKNKNPNQLLVGFALETNNEEENALLKLNKKNLDFIVLNSLNDEGAGFKSDTNKITILDKFGKKETFDLKSKKEVAQDICSKILSLLQ